MGKTERKLLQIGDGSLEVTIVGPDDSTLPAICAAHPAGTYGEAAANLVSETAHARVVCVNPKGIGASSPPSSGHGAYTLEQMVDDIEQVRAALAIDRWVFWGMSGGGWLGQIYAHKYPESLNGLILESVCACFRVRLADPACLLSPFHASWRPALAECSLLAEDSHAAVGDPNATEWNEVEGVGWVFRRRRGPALLVSPLPLIPLTPEMRDAMPVLWTVDARPWLGQLHLPTLVICGTHDPVVPISNAQALHDAIPGSEFLVIEGGGHAPVMERRPELAQTVQRFLSTLPQ